MRHRPCALSGPQTNGSENMTQVVRIMRPTRNKQATGAGCELSQMHPCLVRFAMQWRGQRVAVLLELTFVCCTVTSSTTTIMRPPANCLSRPCGAYVLQ